jgi:hypothetical protein
MPVFKSPNSDAKPPKTGVFGTQAELEQQKNEGAWEQKPAKKGAKKAGKEGKRENTAAEKCVLCVCLYVIYCEYG